MKTARKIVLAGGTGFLGTTLASYFAEQGDEVVILSRNARAQVKRADVLFWDGKTRGPWCEALDGADALINLSGHSVNCRYHEQNSQLMMNSRVDSTRVLGEALARCGAPPRVWLNSSTATIYRHTLGTAHAESSQDFAPSPEAKDQFSVQVASAWEEAFKQAYQEHGLNWTRPVILRTSLVFGPQAGGVWHTLRKLVRLGLGGKMASGKQWVSWIHSEDFCRAVDWLIKSDDARRSGVYNLSSPHPLTNEQMMASLRQVLKRPFGLPASRVMLEIGAWLMQTETELILKSRRVISERLEQEGFQFRFPDFFQALENLELESSGQKTKRRQAQEWKIGKLRLGS